MNAYQNALRNSERDVAARLQTAHIPEDNDPKIGQSRMAQASAWRNGLSSPNRRNYVSGRLIPVVT
jgi:hypothetical protein